MMWDKNLASKFSHREKTLKLITVFVLIIYFHSCVFNMVN